MSTSFADDLGEMPKEGLINGINCYAYMMSHNALQHSIWFQEFSYSLWSGNETVLNLTRLYNEFFPLSVCDYIYVYVLPIPPLSFGNNPFVKYV